MVYHVYLQARIYNPLDFPPQPSNQLPLHVQLRSHDPLQILRITFQSLLNFGRDQLLHNLRAPTSERAGIGERVEDRQHGLEKWRDLDAVEEVVIFALLLDHGPGLVGQDADFFVRVLTAVAALDHGHDDVFGRHEGEFAVHATGNDGGVDYEAGGDVVELI